MDNNYNYPPQPEFFGSGVYTKKDLRKISYYRIWKPMRIFMIVIRILMAFPTFLGFMYTVSIPLLIIGGVLEPSLAAAAVFLFLFGMISCFIPNIHAFINGNRLFEKTPIYNNCGYSFELYPDRIIYRSKFISLSILYYESPGIYLLKDGICIYTSKNSFIYIPAESLGNYFLSAQNFLAMVSPQNVHRSM